jgi:prepilin signal peptidase PulO-like enzyme (type II secretory pathway)
MLRVFVITVSIAIIVYGIILLIRLFSGWRLKKKEEKYQEARTLADLEEKARQVSAEKETILGEVNRNKEVIDNISNTLNQ